MSSSLRRHLLIVAIIVGTLHLNGCAALKALLPGDSQLDNARRFYDQTSDNPYR